MYKSKNVKMSNSEIMREAHRRAKTYDGDYQARFTLAIREVWRELKYGKPHSVTVTNNIATYHYDDKVLQFHGGTMKLLDKQKDAFKETSQPSKVNTPKEEIKEVEVPKLELDRETQLIEAAIKRVLAGRARRRHNGYSGLDSIDDLSYLWQNSYKFDWIDGYNAGALCNSINGDIYNECYIEGRKVLATKNFEHDGQAVCYLATRFDSRIKDHWQGYDSGKTTLQLKKERQGHYKSLDVQETKRKLEADVLQCNSVDDITEYISLNEDMKEILTSKEIQAIKYLAKGYTHRQIAKAGIASNRTIQKAKKKLYPWLKERMAQ